ncbi:hypothetical protein Agabi119p4_9724 [Agaricus bisporus var. burnettii]|uniref:Uncharacterized protein n=1 Tax=Agaricus bisporus var. burnettii TaxID=192524 RepID=A0A8H7C3D8_AGABI|nr:hypothetical protein Agabi119p4_9724 [Agaricus bisporus var. burnettii]
MIDATFKFLLLHCIVDGSSDNELQDALRLPAGMSRIGYDADTERYTFQDEQGVLYESEPGNAYGMLRPIVRDMGDVSKVRPNAFESENSLRSRSTSAASSNLHSFDDFLPSAAITSTSSSLPEQGDLEIRRGKTSAFEIVFADT